MRFEEDRDGARWIDVGSRWYDEVRDVYEKFEITGGDVDGLRRVVEICGSRTMVIATRDDNDIRRAMGSRTRARFRGSSRRLAELRTSKTRAWTQELNSQIRRW
jgi:hypothetical protein